MAFLPTKRGKIKKFREVRSMDFQAGVQRTYGCMNQIGIFGLQALWHFLHLVISLWYIGVGIANFFESYLISSGILKHYKALDLGKLHYLAIVIESEDASKSTQVIQLLRWLASIGVKHVCLYDMDGVLKKSKESIIDKLKNVRLFEGADEKELFLDRKHMTLEFASISDGKEVLTKAANFMFAEYVELDDKTNAEQEDQIFTETDMTEALRAVGCGGPEPDLLLVYGPARCHQGFPAWRIRYTEIVHMGPLKYMRYGALVKAIYKFTMVQQKYGK